jgi:hypothetical protein
VCANGPISLKTGALLNKNPACSPSGHPHDAILRAKKRKKGTLFFTTLAPHLAK